MFFFFFFNDTATTEIYTLSLHDALPILGERPRDPARRAVEGEDADVRVTVELELVEREAALGVGRRVIDGPPAARERVGRSEEHTSELQSRQYLVCRLLLEKKKTIKKQV